MIQEKSWEITDEFWEIVKELIPKPNRKPEKKYQRASGAGRKPMNPKTVLAAIFFVLRTGIQWKALPKEYGASSSIHRYFMAWCKAGVFKRMWEMGLEKYDDVKGIEWEWQSIDASNVKAPLGRQEVGANPTDRG